MKASAGATLIEVLIALGVLLIGIGGTVVGLSQISKEGADIYGERRYEELTHVMGDAVAATVRQYLKAISTPRTVSCNNTSFASFWPVAAGGGLTVGLLSGAPTPAYSGNAAHEAAKARCAHGQTFAAGSSFATKTGIYFCLSFSSAAPAPGSVLEAPPTFAEVNYQLVDLSTDQPVKCQDFDAATHPARGAKVFYTLYWQVKRAGGASYDSYSGSFYAPIF